MSVLNTDLDDFIVEPREALDVEFKEWLDLTDNDHRAALAKEIIALANHGGGYLIVGFTEQPDGSFVPAKCHPLILSQWSQDAVQSIVAKYLDPLIQCRVTHRNRLDSSDRYPIIVVPGGHRVPIRAKASSPDGKRLVAQRIYIRRAGPNSEEPRSAEEWDRLLERCLQNRQAELLDAMRSIMAGTLPGAGTPTPSRLDELRSFETKAIARWTQLTSALPPDAPPRLSHGFYDVGFALDGTYETLGLGNLRSKVQMEVRNHSGWPPFLTLSREPYAPKPMEGTVEVWLGPDSDGSYDTPAHHDFWRVSPDGFLFTRRGYQEDGGFKGKKPGTTFDLTSPTWRLGEAVLQAGYIARVINGLDCKLICHACWTGLAGRNLVSLGNPNRILFDDRAAAQDKYEAVETVPVAALPNALPELVFAMLSPLYLLFDFFDLPKRLVEEELTSLRSRRF